MQPYACLIRRMLMLSICLQEDQAPPQALLSAAATTELWLKISLWLVACADPAYLLSHTKSSR